MILTLLPALGVFCGANLGRCPPFGFEAMAWVGESGRGSSGFSMIILHHILRFIAMKFQLDAIPTRSGLESRPCPIFLGDGKRDGSFGLHRARVIKQEPSRNRRSKKRVILNGVRGVKDLATRLKPYNFSGFARSRRPPFFRWLNARWHPPSPLSLGFRVSGLVRSFASKTSLRMTKRERRFDLRARLPNLGVMGRALCRFRMPDGLSSHYADACGVSFGTGTPCVESRAKAAGDCPHSKTLSRSRTPNPRGSSDLPQGKFQARRNWSESAAYSDGAFAFPVF